MFRFFVFVLFNFLLSTASYAQQCVDHNGDNDGWGWNGNAICLLDQEDYVGRCADNNKSRWGWTGTESCRVEYHSDTLSMGQWPCTDYAAVSDLSGELHSNLCIAEAPPRFISPCFNNWQFSQSVNPDRCRSSSSSPTPSLRAEQALGGVWLDWSLSASEGYERFDDVPSEEIDFVRYKRFGTGVKPVEKFNIYRNGVLLGSTSESFWLDNQIIQNSNSLYTVETVYGVNRNNQRTQQSINIFVKPTNISINNNSDWERYTKSVDIDVFIDEVDDIPNIMDYVLPTAQTALLGAMFDSIRSYQTMTARSGGIGGAISNQRFGFFVGLFIGIGQSLLTADPTDYYAEVTRAANDILISYGITLPNEFESPGFNHSGNNVNHVFQYILIEDLVDAWVTKPWISYSEAEATHEILITTLQEIANIKRIVPNLAGLSYQFDYFTYLSGTELCIATSNHYRIRLDCSRIIN